MASIETANLAGLAPEKHFNVSYIVGSGSEAVNERNDVMLIQAAFKLIGFADFYSKKYFGLTPNDLPEASGICDLKTQQTILAFQRRMANRLLNIDGQIHPASYENRVIKNFSFGRLMTITLLNLEAYERPISLGLPDMVSAIKTIAPSIIFTPPKP